MKCFSVPRSTHNEDESSVVDVCQLSDLSLKVTTLEVYVSFLFHLATRKTFSCCPLMEEVSPSERK